MPIILNPQASPTAADMVAKIKAALFANPAGVGTVTIDGQTVTYTQAEESLQFWEKRAATEAGTRRRVASINLRNAF